VSMYLAGTNVAIHGQASNLLQRKVLVRPNLRHVVYIPSIALCLLGRHQLDINFPHREVALLNCLEHILNQIIRIFSCNFFGFFPGKVFDPLL
jgi:hypothetical protein